MFQRLCLAPFGRVREDWKEVYSLWGKIGLVLFYLYVLYNLVDCVSNSIQPFWGYLPCLKEKFASSGTNVDLFVVFLFRMFHLWPLGFYLFSACFVGYTTNNLLLILIFTSATAYWWNEMARQVGGDCIGSGGVATWAVLIGWPGIAIALKQIDHHVGQAHSREEGEVVEQLTYGATSSS